MKWDDTVCVSYQVAVEHWGQNVDWRVALNNTFKHIVATQDDDDDTVWDEVQGNASYKRYDLLGRLKRPGVWPQMRNIKEFLI